MKKKKNRLLIFFGVIGLLFLLAVCVWFEMTYGVQLLSDNAESDTTLLSHATEPTQILLNQEGSRVLGSGANVSGSTITIYSGGSYRISGTLQDGQISVDAGNKETVELVLHGADITNLSDAAIYIENAGCTVLLLEEGTINRVQSGTETERERKTLEEEQDAKGAAIYAKDNLSITGTGSLQVFGYINNGIHTKNALSIDNGNIEVEAWNNGIKGNDSVRITGGNFSIHSGGDGIKSDDTTGDGYGVISIENGTFFIQSRGDAIQAETSLTIAGGTFHMITSDGSGDTFPSLQSSQDNPDSDWDLSDITQNSAKGLKSGKAISISDGTFFVDSYDDAVHSNGTIQIFGGVLTLATKDDGIHADAALTISGGEIQITKSYEGLEANQISIEGGLIDIVASDDGINANGGPDSRGWRGETTINKVKDMPNLTIRGGEVKVNAGGDGLDSNGNLSIEGGEIIIDGPSSNWNGALDSGSENGGICTISGGTILAVGSSGMAETFDESSKQYSFRHTFERSYGAGSEICIVDADGKELCRHTTKKEISSVVFSSPELALGETYTLCIDEQTVEITLDAVSTISGRRRGWD